MFQNENGIMRREMYKPVSHLLQKAVFSSKMLLMEEILPTEDPSKDASLGFTCFAFGSKLAKGAAVSSFPQILLTFSNSETTQSTHQPASQPPDHV